MTLRHRTGRRVALLGLATAAATVAATFAAGPATAATGEIRLAGGSADLE